jgi:hypothetical protein
VNDSIAEKLSDPPRGFIEVERTEEHVRYRSANWKDAPKSAAFSCHVSDVHVDDSGLVVLGSVDVKPPPTATFSATLPEWTLSGDCHNKSVRQILTPLHVQVVGMDPRHEVYLVAEPVIEPPGTWSYTRSTSLPGASPPTLDVSFTRRNVPPTGGQSVYVYTNLGVRWINIGVLPPRPEVSERELLARTIDLISECMAISDRWGEGVMNLDWLVDPPDVFVDFGIPPIYEWVVNIDRVEEVDSIDLVAVGPDGARRQLGTARVVEGHVVAQVVTATDETLEIRTGTPMAGPTPRVSRRVVVPYSSTPVGNDVVAFGFEEGSVGVLRLDGTTQQLDAITADTSDRPATAEQIEALQRRNELGLGATVRTRHLGASTVAAYDRGEIVMGVAGAFVPAVQPRQE